MLLSRLSIAVVLMSVVAAQHCKKTKISKRDSDGRIVWMTVEKPPIYCCNGYEKFNKHRCIPECEHCDHGTCEGPEKCRCNQGYELTANNNCEPICSVHCTNGTCVAPETCECYLGYKETGWNYCEPMCDGDCVNGVCEAPGKCRCNQGYKLTVNNRCEPICQTGCMNGKCEAPETCVCKLGYRATSPYACEPFCNGGCDQGYCEAPGQCTCNKGLKKVVERFSKGHWTRCVPETATTETKSTFGESLEASVGTLDAKVGASSEQPYINWFFRIVTEAYFWIFVIFVAFLVRFTMMMFMLIRLLFRECFKLHI